MTLVETMNAISEEMKALGWDIGAARGSVKRDKDGAQQSAWGSQEFMHDLEDARETVEARQAWAELNRRHGT